MKSLLPRIVSLLLVPCLLADPALAALCPLGDAPRITDNLFTQEALAVVDLESRGTYVPAARAEEMQREAAEVRGAAPETETADTRRDFLLGSAAAATVAALVTVGCSPKRPTSPRRRHPEVQSAWDMFLQSKKELIPFKSVQEYRQGPIADLMRALVSFEQELTQNLTRLGEYKVGKSEYKPLERYYDLENRTWMALQQKVADPALRKALAGPYSHEIFNRFVLYDVPRYAAQFGFFTYHQQMMTTDDYGDGEYVGFAPVFFEVTAVENLDLGSDLQSALREFGADITQRLTIDRRISADLELVAVKPNWGGKNYYKTVAYVKSDIAASAQAVLGLMELLLQKYGIRMGERKGLRFSTDFRAQLASVVAGKTTALAQSQHNALFYWLTRAQVDIERGMTMGGEPLPLMLQRLKRANDRHEGMHFIDDLDPDHRLEKATAYAMDGSMQEQADGSFNAFVHGEINGQIGELRYGDPPEGLRVLIQSTLEGVGKGLGQVSMENEHEIAWTWISEKMLDLLERNWGSRFGMEFDPASQVSRRDQALIQLYRIAMPENEAALKALMDAVKAEHVKEYSRKYTPKPVPREKGFFENWREWVPGVVAGSVVVIVLVRIVLRFWPGRNSGGPGGAAPAGPKTVSGKNAGGKKNKNGDKGTKPGRGGTRRGFLEGIFGVGALGPAAAQDLQSVPPSPMDETVRRDVIYLFLKNDNFRKEIDYMFDNHLVGQDSGLERQEVHDAMKAFVVFVQNAKIVAVRNPVVVASVDHEANEFNYNPDKWEDVKRFGISFLIHEAIHLSKRQQSWFKRMRAAGKIIGEKIPFVKPEEKPRILADAPVRNAIWTIISMKWQAETQATYGQTAFLRALAAGQGFSTTRDYLLREAAPFAAAMNKTPQELMDWANLQGPRAGPAISVLSDQWSYATYYDPGSVTLPFSFYVFMIQVLNESPLNILTWLYAEDPDVADLVSRQINKGGLNAQQQLRIAEWAHATFFRDEEPGSGIVDRLRTYLPAATVAVVASLGGLAFWRWKRRGGGDSGPSARPPTGSRPPDTSGPAKPKKGRREGTTRRGVVARTEQAG